MATPKNEWELSLQTYVDALDGHAQEYGIEELRVLFDERIDDVEWDDESLEEVHFQIGFITCAAELRGIHPETLMEEMLDAPRARVRQLGTGSCSSHRAPRRSKSVSISKRNTH